MARLRAAAGGAGGDDYNYDAFSFELEAPEFRRWRHDGVQLGEVAPDFALTDVAGARTRLSDLRGRTVVLEFGSYTCPVFCGHIAPMDALAQRHPEAEFLAIYVREAHPGEKIGPQRTAADKRRLARELLGVEALRRTLLIDTVDGAVHRRYGGAWNPVYVVDAGGRVVLRRAWNDPTEVEAVLVELRDGRRPEPRESMAMGRPARRRPAGLELLERGGRRALLDFYRSAPPPLQEMLRRSPSTAVAAVVTGRA
jgi:peroxiredoxin